MNKENLQVIATGIREVIKVGLVVALLVSYSNLTNENKQLKKEVERTASMRDIYMMSGIEEAK